MRRGYVKKVQDIQLNGPVIEIVGQNPNTVFITTPIGLYQSLGIRLPILVLVVKNLRKQFTFDILVSFFIRDDSYMQVRRNRGEIIPQRIFISLSLQYNAIKLYPFLS